jgi:uncharacterized protein (TIGR03083 family)
VELETTRSVQAIRPLTRRTDAREVALAAYARMLALLEALEPDAWDAPTECGGWHVTDVVGHVIGAGESCASVRELVRQQRWGRRHAADFGGNALDATNDLQVREHAGLSPAAMVASLRQVAPAAVRGRMRLPRLLRAVTLPMDPGGSTAAGMPARLSLGHLMDVVYTRDVWLHTIDIARATHVTHVPDANVDRRVVEDVVAEWARRHGQPFTLELTGPAGGRFVGGHAPGEQLSLDAVEFCRILSGRSPGSGLLAQPVPF